MSTNKTGTEGNQNISQSNRKRMILDKVSETTQESKVEKNNSIKKVKPTSSYTFNKSINQVNLDQIPQSNQEALILDRSRSNKKGHRQFDSPYKNSMVNKLSPYEPQLHKNKVSVDRKQYRTKLKSVDQQNFYLTS